VEKICRPLLALCHFDPLIFTEGVISFPLWKVLQIVTQQTFVQCCGFPVSAFVRLSLTKEVIGKPNSG